MKLISLLALLLLIPFVSAQLIFEPYEIAEIKMSCFNPDSGLCGGSVKCNLTVFAPNQSVIIDNEPMTFQGSYYNYTTWTQNLTDRGEYNCIGNCYKVGANGYVSFTFIVSSISGRDQGNVAIGILLSLMALAFLFCFIGFKLSQSPQMFPIALFFLLIGILLGIVVIYQGYIYNREILISSGGANLSNKLYVGLMYSLIGMGFIAMTFLIVKTLKEFRERKSIIKYGEGYNPKTKQYE